MSDLTFCQVPTYARSEMADDKTDKALLALNLKVVRQLLGLTQAEFGVKVDRSRQSVIAWEDPDSSAKPDEEMLGFISALVGMTPRTLRYSRLGLGDREESPNERRMSSAWDFPARLEGAALDFEQEASAADRDFRRYIQNALRDPMLVAMFAGELTGAATPTDQQKAQYQALIDGLRLMMRLRHAASGENAADPSWKRAAREHGGKIAEGLSEGPSGDVPAEAVGDKPRRLKP